MVDIKKNNQQTVKLNLGIIIPFLEKYGGAERYLVECVRFWQHQHDITIYTTRINHDLLKEHGVLPHVKLIQLTPYFEEERSLLLNAVLLPKIWRGEIGQHDIYHTHLWPTHLIDRQPMVWFPHEPLRVLHDLRFEYNLTQAESEIGRKIHIYPKYNYDYVGNHQFEAYLQAMEKMSQTTIPACIVANSHYTARYLSDIYQRNVTEVVYPGIQAENYINLPMDSNLFVTISQLWVHKRIKLLIEAMALTDNTQLVIIGSGPERETLLEFIARLGLEDRVFIVSGLNNHELNLLMSRTCAFLFSAIREPFGIVILEAMAAGKPIIAVNEGGYTEVCEPEFAFLLPPLPSVFAEKITFLQQNPNIAYQMGQKGLEKSRQYTWQRTADCLEKILIDTYLASRPMQPITLSQEPPTLFGIQYYLWYGNGFGCEHWNDNKKSGYVNDNPLLGYYSSTHGETIRYHLDLFEQMNLDFVILNLHVDSLGVNSIELMSIQHVFDIAKERNSPLKFVIQLAPYVDSVQKAIAALQMIHKVFTHYPNYLTISAKPALFWFWTGNLDGNKNLMAELSLAAKDFFNMAVSLRLPNLLDEDKFTFGFFSGYIPFSPLELGAEENWHKIWDMAYQNAKATGMHYRGVTLSPGYDDTHLEDDQRVGNPYRCIPRHEGKTYQQCFDFAAQLTEKPNMVVISTFNEYHENSHIEPSLRHNNKYIELSKEFIARLRNQWRKSDDPSITTRVDTACI